MAGGREWEGYRDGRQLEHLLQRLDAQERRRVGRALAGRGRLQRESDAARALQELLVAAVGGRARAEEILRGNRRFQHPIENPNGNPATLIFPIDGRIGERTRYLRRHVQNSNAIRELQERLAAAGLYRGRIDGIPGQLTLAALAQAHESDAMFRRVFGVARARPAPGEERTPPSPEPEPGPPPEPLPEIGRGIADEIDRVNEADARRAAAERAARRPPPVEASMLGAGARRISPTTAQEEARGRLTLRLSEIREGRAVTARVEGNDIVIGEVRLSAQHARALLAPGGRLNDLLNGLDNPNPTAIAIALQAHGFLFNQARFETAIAELERYVHGGPQPLFELSPRERALLGLHQLMGGNPLSLNGPMRRALLSMPDTPPPRPPAEPPPPRDRDIHISGVRIVPALVTPTEAWNRQHAGEHELSNALIPPARSTPDWERLSAMTAEEGGRRLRALEAERTRVRREQEAAAARAEAAARSPLPPPIGFLGARLPPRVPPSSGSLTDEQTRWLASLEQPPRGPDGTRILVGLSAGHNWRFYRDVAPPTTPGEPPPMALGARAHAPNLRSRAIGVYTRVPSLTRIHVHRSFFDFLGGTDGPHNYQRIFFGSNERPPDMTGVSDRAHIVGERPTNYALFAIVREMYQIGGYHVWGQGEAGQGPGFQTEDRASRGFSVGHIGGQLAATGADRRPRLWTSLHVNSDNGRGLATGAVIVPYDGANPRPGEMLAAMIRALGRQGNRGGPGSVRAGLGGATVWHRGLGIGSLLRRHGIPLNLLEVGFEIEHQNMLGSNLADSSNLLHIAALAVSAYTDMRLIPGMTQEQAIANGRVRLAAVLARHGIPITDPAMIAAVGAAHQPPSVASPPPVLAPPPPSDRTGSVVPPNGLLHTTNYAAALLPPPRPPPPRPRPLPGETPPPGEGEPPPTEVAAAPPAPAGPSLAT